LEFGVMPKVTIMKRDGGVQRTELDRGFPV
jgi:hypothetical protein